MKCSRQTSSCARFETASSPLDDVDLSTITPDELAQLLAPDSEPADADHLYLYSIIPAPLQMQIGKAGAQLGHGFEYSLTYCESVDPETAHRYKIKDNAGSKVAMSAKSVEHMIQAYALARELGVPCAWVVDSHHVMLPVFTGAPIVTALGVGPCTKAQAKKITKRFKCL